MDAGKRRVGQPAPDLAEFLHVQCAPLRAEAQAISRKRAQARSAAATVVESPRERSELERARAYRDAQRAVLEQQRDRNRRIEKRVAEQTRAHFREPTPIYDVLRTDTA